MSSYAANVQLIAEVPKVSVFKNWRRVDAHQSHDIEASHPLYHPRCVHHRNGFCFPHLMIICPPEELSYHFNLVSVPLFCKIKLLSYCQWLKSQTFGLSLYFNISGPFKMGIRDLWLVYSIRILFSCSYNKSSSSGSISGFSSSDLNTYYSHWRIWTRSSSDAVFIHWDWCKVCSVHYLKALTYSSIWYLDERSANGDQG